MPNTPRRFFYSSIQQLEQLYRESSDNFALLEDLKEELAHRKTERAARLRKQVVERLTSAKVSARPVSPESEPPGPERNHDTAPWGEGQRADRSTPPPVIRGPVHYPEVNEPAPSFPPITNDPVEILSAWTAMEVLSPPAYRRPEDLAGGDRKRVASFRDSALPWERGEKARPNTRLYYQVVLGSIELEPAIARLIERYGDTRPERPGAQGKAALAVIVVDKQGRLVESPAVGVSSFAWGVMSALRGELADLARWPEEEPRLVERLEKVLLDLGGADDEEKRRQQPLTAARLAAAYRVLVEELALPNDWLEPPEFAIRSYAYFKDPNPPEPLLLNSFFLADLAVARQLFRADAAPQNLRRYLGLDPLSNRRDLLRDRTALEQAVSPEFTPPARWPAKDRHPLVLLQQAAVNLAFAETKTGGIIGVNGPPGTGKTTLLRDMVAGVIAARAQAMAEFEDPETAFEHSGQKLKAGAGWLHMYRLNPALRGYEMVVASSNNKAVENVSAELPGIGAIAKDVPGLRYFKTLSDALHQSETWGAIAAVLGNVQNRGRFKKTFWWDDDFGLNSYLCAAAGSPRKVQVTDPETGQAVERLPRIVEAENPPKTHDEALERWRLARKEFHDAMEKCRQWQVWLESLRAQVARLPSLAHAEANAAEQLQAAVRAVQQGKQELATARENEEESLRQLEQATEEVRLNRLSVPSLWARLFRTRSARAWSARAKALRGNHRQAGIVCSNAKREVERREAELRRAVIGRNSREEGWKVGVEQHQQAKQKISEAQQKQGVVVVDETFFHLAHAKRHQLTPWFPPEAQKIRDDVFIAAMNLHRAFVDAAAKPLRHNLGALMNAFTTQTLPDAGKQALLPDLWASLFLVVPMISTTFASVNRMLGKLPSESLGWLFVDEAGQAVPQAAVGAILRTRRAVVVGDPMQIEPVVVLPDTLTHAICRRFGVDPDGYGAPSASVQTLADAASAYGTEFEAKIGSRVVGVPLLVHRRCREPMFGISNAIAYSGLMVPAKPPGSSPIEGVLGPSKWIHIEGGGEDKWCREEGDEVLRLLGHLARARVKPDLYIITPFVIVADRLRERVRASGVLSSWEIDEEWRWINERIGTVHTAQGREAEAVILVLGAPYPAQTGARNWAGGRPNLLNVAVTRAKEVIYVIGNRQLWREAGLFGELDKRLQ